MTGSPPTSLFTDTISVDDPPADLIEKYDITHVGHLQIVIRDNDSSEVLGNILKMLSMCLSVPSTIGIGRWREGRKWN